MRPRRDGCPGCRRRRLRGFGARVAGPGTCPRHRRAQTGLAGRRPVVADRRRSGRAAPLDRTARATGSRQRKERGRVTSHNASLIVDRQVEAGRVDKTAFVAPDATLTYDELRGQVNRAGALLSSASAASSACCWCSTTPRRSRSRSSARCGSAPCRSRSARSTRTTTSATSSTTPTRRSSSTDAPALPRLREALAGTPLRYVVRGGDAPTSSSSTPALAAQADELAPAPTHRDDMAFWLYSSGSTGKPKGVVHLQHDIEFTCEHYARQVLGLREDDVTFSTTKLFHAYGLGNGLSFPLWFGATSVLNAGRADARDDAGHAARAPARRCSSRVPALYGAGRARRRAPTAPSTPCASASRPPRRCRRRPTQRWKERFGLDIIDGIGSTEMLHIYCSNRAGRGRAGDDGAAGAGLRAAARRRARRRARGPGDRRPRGARRLLRRLLLAPAREDQGLHARRLVRHRRPLRARARTAPTSTWAGWTTCSRSAACGSRRSTWSTCCSSTRASPASAWSASPSRTPAHRRLRRVRRRRATTRWPTSCAPGARSACGATSTRTSCEFVDELPRTLTGKVQRFRLRELAEERAPA